MDTVCIFKSDFNKLAKITDIALKIHSNSSLLLVIFRWLHGHFY